MVAGKGRSNGVHTPAQKSLINVIWILLFFHCPIIMIGLGGLLLVVPTCCADFSFMGGVAKEYRTKLGCEKYFRRFTYHRWRCSYELPKSCYNLLNWNNQSLFVGCTVHTRMNVKYSIKYSIE